MSHHASKLLTDCLIASGAEPALAARAVAAILPAAVACELIPQSHLDTWERDRLIYELRTAPTPHNLTIDELCERFGKSPSLIKRVIKDQMMIRRSIA
jgi:AraC-like DNA-binding protein